MIVPEIYYIYKHFVVESITYICELGLYICICCSMQAGWKGCIKDIVYCCR